MDHLKFETKTTEVCFRSGNGAVLQKQELEKKVNMTSYPHRREAWQRHFGTIKKGKQEENVYLWLVAQSRIVSAVPLGGVSGEMCFITFTLLPH